VLLRGANDFPEFMESPLPKSAQGADHRHSAADIKKTLVKNRCKCNYLLLWKSRKLEILNWRFEACKRIQSSSR
jgi:hypothetical protein